MTHQRCYEYAMLLLRDKRAEYGWKWVSVYEHGQQFFQIDHFILIYWQSKVLTIHRFDKDIVTLAKPESGNSIMILKLDSASSSVWQEIF